MKINIKTAVDKIEFIGTKILDIIAKYCYVLWIFCFFLINGTIGKVIIEETRWERYFIYLVPLFVVLSASIFVISRLKKCFEADKRSIIWFLLSIVLIFKTGNILSVWGNLVVSLFIPLMLYIVLKQRKLFWAIFLICVVGDLFVPYYITTFFPYFLALYLFTVENKADLRKKSGIIAGICSVVLFSYGIFKNYLGADNFLSDSISFQLYNDYFHFGFCTRGLLASIIYLFTGISRPWAVMKWVLFGIHLFCILGIVLFSYLISREIPEKHKEDSFVVLLALLASGAVRYMCITDRNMLYFDCILMLITLICIYLTIKSKVMFLVPVLCAVGMCFHHIFGILFFPFIFVCIAFKCICNKKIKDIILLCVTTLVTVALFIYFQFLACNFVPVSLDEALDYFIHSMGRAEYTDTFKMNVNYVIFNGKVESYGIQFAKMSMDSKIGLAASAFFNFLLVMPEIMIINSFINNTKAKVWGVLALAQFIPLISYFEVDYYRWDVAIAFFVAVVLLALVALMPDNNWLSDTKRTNRNEKIVNYIFGVVVFIIANI